MRNLLSLGRFTAPSLIVLVISMMIISCGGGGGGPIVPEPDPKPQEEREIAALRDIGNGQFNDYVMDFNGTSVRGGEMFTLNENDLTGHITQAMWFDRWLKHSFTGLKNFTDMMVDGEGLNTGYITVTGENSAGKIVTLKFTSQMWKGDQITQTIDFKQFQLKDKPNYVKISGVGQTDPELVVVQVANECKAPEEPPVKREHIKKKNGIFKWIGLLIGVGMFIASRGSVGCPDPIDADTFTVCVPPAISTPVTPPVTPYLDLTCPHEVNEGATITLSISTNVPVVTITLPRGGNVSRSNTVNNNISYSEAAPMVTADTTLHYVVTGGGITKTCDVLVKDIPVIPPVNQKPNITDIECVKAGLCVDVIVTATDPDGTIDSYYYQFGDSGPLSTLTDDINTASHCYAVAGTYTIRVTVTDNDGATDTDECVVTLDDGGGQIGTLGYNIVGPGGNGDHTQPLGDGWELTKNIEIFRFNSEGIRIKVYTLSEVTMWEVHPETTGPDMPDWADATKGTVMTTLDANHDGTWEDQVSIGSYVIEVHLSDGEQLVIPISVT